MKRLRVEQPLIQIIEETAPIEHLVARLSEAIDLVISSPLRDRATSLTIESAFQASLVTKSIPESTAQFAMLFGKGISSSTGGPSTVVNAHSLTIFLRLPKNINNFLIMSLLKEIFSTDC